MKDWEEEYRRKQISAEEAAKFVKSGDYMRLCIVPSTVDEDM